MTDLQRLEQLIRSQHVCIALSTFEERHALSLVRDAAVELNRPLWIWSVAGGVREGLIGGSPGLPQSEDPIQGLNNLLSFEKHPICVTLDLAAHFRNDKVLRTFRNVLHQFEQNGSQLVIIDHAAELPEVVRSHVTPFELSLPGENELETLVPSWLREANAERRIEIDISRRGFQAIIRNLCGLPRRLARQIILDCVAIDRRFTDEDLNAVVVAKRKALSAGGLLEFIETPVDLGEIGGLTRLKAWLRIRQNALTKEAAEFGLTAPRGVLMLGVQGAGKSLCAKAIATGWQRPLLRLDVGALYDRYVGESERRLRDALAQAEKMAPIILWVDEIEKAFASAASRSTDGGLSQRMFGSLLTWMQEHRAPVFLVGTANDIEALPPELLRKGRFDEVFFVDLPCEATRREILSIHLRKRRRDPSAFDLDSLAAACEGFSGAEIEQAVLAALHDAFAGRRELDTNALKSAIESSPPLSVTMAERIEGLREWAAGRCVPAE
jgi:AAA+ superfamily predicted ATPase